MPEGRVWERPASVAIPKVWARYESQKAMPNGRRPVFRIQDYTEEWREDVLHCMTAFFLRDEPLSRSLKIVEDRAAVDEFREFFEEFLQRKMVLVAIVENPEELGDETLPAMAGCNMTVILTSEEGHQSCNSEKLKKIFCALELLEEKKNCFKYYETSEYMYAFGLSVNPRFRGHGLGCEILKARFPLCKAVGVKATVTVFTAPAAQRSAEKAGFETLAELAFDEMKDENGRNVFDVDGGKTMKLMGARVP